MVGVIAEDMIRALKVLFNMEQSRTNFFLYQVMPNCQYGFKIESDNFFLGFSDVLMLC